jgi:hypothetical protein
MREVSDKDSERKSDEHTRDDPEANNDSRFRPAQEFEMMVYGRHAEKTLLAT